MNKVVFDTESTGFDVNVGDRLVEIGAVELNDNNHPTGALFHVYINPQRDISEEATQIHGLTTEFLKDYPTFDKIKDNFLKFIEGKELIAHHLPFNLGFLENELGFNLPNKKTDTLLIANNLFSGQKNHLDALCHRFDVDSSHISYGGTLLNAYCLALVYQELMRISEAE